MKLRILARKSPQILLGLGRARLPVAFRRACLTPAYRRLLQEHGLDPARVRNADDVLALAPPLTKAMTFGRFGIEALTVPGTLAELSSVLTSSGRHGRNFAFGLDTRSRAGRAAADIDLGLEYAFQVDSRRSLLINCLPMGVRFTSRATCVADVSVREDMATALAKTFGPFFDQIVLVVDPLFLKRLLDYGRDEGMDWSRFRVHAIVGEEPTGEGFRDYVAARLGTDNDAADGGFVGSSFGVGELGLNLLFETRESVRMHRAARRHERIAHSLFGTTGARGCPPMLYAYDPLRTWIEVLEPDAHGYGALTVSMLSRDQPVPLVRYRTGDVARLVSRETLAAACDEAGIAAPSDPFPWVAIGGRDSERLPDGTSVLDYKDALYADHGFADACTGAFKLRVEGGRTHIDLQLRPGAAQPADAHAFIAASGGTLSDEALHWWPYERFPHGMGVDYERKFDYYTAH